MAWRQAGPRSNWTSQISVLQPPLPRNCEKWPFTPSRWGVRVPFTTQHEDKPFSPAPPDTHQLKEPVLCSTISHRHRASWPPFHPGTPTSQHQPKTPLLAPPLLCHSSHGYSQPSTWMFMCITAHTELMTSGGWWAVGSWSWRGSSPHSRLHGGRRRPGTAQHQREVPPHLESGVRSWLPVMVTVAPHALDLDDRDNGQTSGNTSALTQSTP